MTSSPAGKHTVRVINEHARNKVVPGRQKARLGDEIVFENRVSEDVTLPFLDPVLRDLGGGRVERCTIAAGGSASFLVDESKQGTYTYIAYCHAADDVAIGASQPKIIIYQ